MMMLRTLLFCVLLCGALSIDEESKNLLLELHNKHRAKEGASNMNQLIWDDQLEKEAADWASGCEFEHQMKERGENLAFDTNTTEESNLIKSSFKGWFDEKDLYTYGQQSCGASCHYTQLVWWSTRRVGCETKRCGTLAPLGAKNAWYIVCFYDPKGNMGGKTPYKKGSACTECRDDQTCETGLCKGGSDPCEDLNDNCDMWANQMDQCTQNEAFMKTDCALSCKFCKGGKGGDKGGSNGGDTGGSEDCDKGGSKGGDKDKNKPDSGKCEDKNESCERWANNRECTRNPGYMKRVCAKSCNTCTDNTECYDANGNCRKWTESGECDRNPGWMHEYCKRSCGECAEDCTDSHNDCEYWARLGECWNNPDWMRRNCRRACGSCSGNGSGNGESKGRTKGRNKGGSRGRNKGGSRGRNKGRNKGGSKGGSKCKDQHKNCGRWAEQGYCERRRQYMKGYCPESCDVC